MNKAVVKLCLWSVFACMLMMSCPVWCTAQSSVPNPSDIVAGTLLVKIPVGSPIGDLAASYGLTLLNGVPNDGIYELGVPRGTSESYFASRLNQDSRVIFAETEPKVVAPGLSGEQFHYAFDMSPDSSRYVNQQAYQQVGLKASSVSAAGPGVIVAVLDTGATYTHPDLVGHYLHGINEIKPTSPAWDQPDGVTNIACGHGTMVAGIIAKVDPLARILPVRVLNADGQGQLIDVINGIDYAISKGAQVINMSFGTSKSSLSLQSALSRATSAGIVLVASAGNADQNTMHFPAGYPNVIGVASVEANNTKSDFSNFGNFVDVVAPGDGIRSTYYDGGYASWSGTSFAAPFVSGEAAAILENYPGLDAIFLSDYIQLTATSVDGVNPAYAGLLGAGLINISLATGSGY